MKTPDIPIPISSAELLTAAPGLYVLPERKQGRAMLDISVSDERFEGELILLARVREGGDIPAGLDFEVRPDGYQIIKQWVPAPWVPA